MDAAKITPKFKREMSYPFTLTGKFSRFPWRWNWHNNRMMRLRVYLLPVIFAFFYKYQSTARQDWNMKWLAETRAHYVNRYWDPVKED